MIGRPDGRLMHTKEVGLCICGWPDARLISDQRGRDSERQEKVIDWGRDPEGAPYGVVRERELACLANCRKRRDNDGVGKSIKNQAGVWRENVGRNKGIITRRTKKSRVGLGRKRCHTPGQGSTRIDFCQITHLTTISQLPYTVTSFGCCGIVCFC